MPGRYYALIGLAIVSLVLIALCYRKLNYVVKTLDEQQIQNAT